MAEQVRDHRLSGWLPLLYPDNPCRESGWAGGVSSHGHNFSGYCVVRQLTSYHHQSSFDADEVYWERWRILEEEPAVYNDADFSQNWSCQEILRCNIYLPHGSFISHELSNGGYSSKAGLTVKEAEWRIWKKVLENDPNWIWTRKAMITSIDMAACWSARSEWALLTNKHKSLLTNLERLTSTNLTMFQRPWNFHYTNLVIL